MTLCSVTRSRNDAIASTACLLCACILLTVLPIGHAQDPNDKANSLLDSLKRRSPEERWQRVKKLYPADSTTARRNSPSRLPNDGQREQIEGEIPPSPEPTQLIPRLTGLPMDTSDDWLASARDPVELADDVAFQPADALPVASAPGEKPVGNENTSAPDAPAVSKEGAVPVPGGQEAEMKKGPTGDVVSTGPRPLGERLINRITPFYDRDQDSDIRQFAVEKGKEYGVTFQAKTYPERSFPDIVLAWEATNFFYHPLYFSDPALERTGHVHRPIIQPFASIARFGTQVIFLPYQMTIDPPCDQVYPLGYYRPGDCAPKLHYQVPLNAQAAAVQAAAFTGLYFLIVQ